GDNADGARVRVNGTLARSYARQFRELARELKLAGEVALDHILRAPGVLDTHDEPVDAEDLWPTIQQALRTALGQLVRMREREGAHLRKELVRRIRLMRQAAARVRRQTPRVMERYREQLHQRVQQAGLDPSVIEEERLHKELVLFADRSDISEEHVRL